MRFLLLLLVAFVAAAQNAFWLDLSGPWRANDGISEFEVQLPLRTPNDSIRSLKRTIPLESQVRDPLSLTIGAIAESYELIVNGALVGVVRDAAYQSHEFQLEPGDQLTIVSDGVLEAENEECGLFGFERTRTLSHKSAIEIAQAARGWGQTDDITVVTVRRTR